jgi:hypothetical protein
MATKETWEHIGTPEMDDATLRAIWMIRYGGSDEKSHLVSSLIMLP